MTPSLTPLPPSITHTTTRLTHADAATHLAAFLTHTDAHPAYRPDSTLSSTGPVSASASLATGSGAASGSAGGGGTNLTLVHLRRVLAGMRGRRVGGVMDLGGDEETKDDAERPRKRARVQADQQQQGQGEQEDGAMTWQDKDDYELAQDELLEDDVAGEDQQAAPQPASGSGEVVERPEEVVAVDVADSAAEKGAAPPVDRDARKRDKKERKAEMKKRAAEERRKRA